MSPEAAGVDTPPGSHPWRSAFDPLSPGTANDPFSILAQARREEPVFHLPKYDMWVVTRFADADPIMRDWERFATTPYGEGSSTIPAEVAAELGADPATVNPVFNPDVLLGTDPPDHSRKRRAYQYAFTPKAVAKYEVIVRDTVDQLLDGFVADGSVDWVERFAVPLPIMVISKLIGLPSDRVGEFGAFFEASFEAHSAGLDPNIDAAAAWRRLVGFSEYFLSFIEERRSAPQDDLASEVIHALGDDGRPLLSNHEVLTGLAGLALAGGETTTSLLTNVVLELHRRPDQWQAVAADRSLLLGAVEETMRYRGPVAAALRRTKVEVEVSGVTIPAGAMVYVELHSVNRDEAAFADADRFDIHRADAAKQLGFGISIHKCVGAPLARLEAQVALDRVLDRLPDLRIPEQPLAYRPQILVPRLESLVVEWDA